MSKRTRSALVRIAGQEVALAAPGLKQIKRRNGVNLYWVKDESPLFAGQIDSFRLRAIFFKNRLLHAGGRPADES